MIKRADQVRINNLVSSISGKVAIQRYQVDPGEYDGKMNSIVKATLEKGFVTRYHKHEGQEEIFFIVSGVATYNDNGKICELHPGDVAICRNGECHAIGNDYDEPVEIVELNMMVDDGTGVNRSVFGTVDSFPLPKELRSKIKHYDELRIKQFPDVSGNGTFGTQHHHVDPGEYDGKLNSIATAILDPGFMIEYHVHNGKEEVFFILDGVATYNDNGTMYELYPGDVAVCRNGEGHAIGCKKDTPVTLIEINMPVE